MDTDLRLAITRNLRRWFLTKPEMQKANGISEVWNLMQAKPDQFDPRYYLVPIMHPLIKGERIDEVWFDEFVKLCSYGITEIVTNATAQFGSMGDAFMVEYKSLEQMADYYKRKGI